MLAKWSSCGMDCLWYSDVLQLRWLLAWWLGVVRMIPNKRGEGSPFYRSTLFFWNVGLYLYSTVVGVNNVCKLIMHSRCK